jgi:hypothetical protein
VLDGLAFDQWLLLKKNLEACDKAWRFQESTAFAWVPTLTSVTRRSGHMKHIGVSFLRIGWKLMFQSSVRPFASMLQQDCPLGCLICLNQDSDAIPSLDHHQPH